MKIFEKLQKMSDDNLDIRLSSISNISDIKIKDGNGFVTFGIDIKTANDLISNKKFIGGALFADKEQFDNLTN